MACDEHQGIQLWVSRCGGNGCPAVMGDRVSSCDGQWVIQLWWVLGYPAVVGTGVSSCGGHWSIQLWWAVCV